MSLIKNLMKCGLVIGLASPSIVLAATTTFYLLNSGDSVVNPITITNGTLSYKSTEDGPGCNGSIPVNSYLNEDPQVKTGQQFKLTFTPPNLDPACFDSINGYGPEQFSLQISQVDGKSIDQTCAVSGGYLDSPDANNSGYTIKITETTNHFFCEFPIGAQKRS